MGKVKDTINNVWTGLMFGIKNTENEALTQLGGSEVADSGTHQEVSSHRVSEDLLKGVLSQQVKELRYRTYYVDREAKQYEYFSPTLAKKREKYDTKFVKYENSENLNVITIQLNERSVGTVNEALKEAEYVDEKTIFVEPKKKYNINITRNFIPRFKLEEFTKKLVVFELEEGKTVKLDFYVSKYPDDKVFISKGFVREVENIRDKHIKSDILDFNEVGFMTSNAYKLDDMIVFLFNNLSFEKVLEFDGDYILRFKADIVTNAHDMIDDYYNPEMAEKYKTKQKKELTLDLSDQLENTFVCERCGKVIQYDIDSVDELVPTQGRDIDDEQERTNTTEYMDIQITEQTYGKRLCNDCLKQYLKEMGEINDLK